MAGLSFEHLYSEQLALMVRPSHPLAGLPAPNLQQVASFQLLVPPHGAIIRPEVDALLIAGGISRLSREIETVSNSLGRSYALLTDAVWVISEGVVERDIAAGNLVRLAIDTQATLGPIGVTTRSDAALPLPALDLLSQIRDVAAQR